MNISDEQLVLLYYGESDDPELAAQVAASPELSQRFETLAATLAVLDEVELPERDDDYGVQVWQRIAPRLPSPKPAFSGWQWLLQPRWSWAGVASLGLVAVVSFWLGGRGVVEQTMPTATSEAWTQATTDLFIAGHLGDAERWLTHLSNASGRIDPTWTESLLRNNRLYRIALSQRATTQDITLMRVLDDLEFILLRTANASGNDNAFAGAEANAWPQPQRVLFQLRVLHRQWTSPASNPRGNDHVSNPTI